MTTPGGRTSAHYNDGLTWIQDHATDAHHPQRDEFVAAFTAGNFAGWGSDLYDELHAHDWVRPNQFGALRLTNIGEEVYRRVREGAAAWEAWLLELFLDALVDPRTGAYKGDSRKHGSAGIWWHAANAAGRTLCRCRRVSRGFRTMSAGGGSWKPTWSPRMASQTNHAVPGSGPTLQDMG